MVGSMRWAARFLALAISINAAPAYAAVTTLIFDDEALRPNDVVTSPDRAITRGPTVKLDDSVAGPVAHRPFDFKVHIEAHGGAAVDPNKIHIIYLKQPNVDLTERLRPFISTAGIDMPTAIVPEGDHPVRIDVEDSLGHVSHTFIKLDAKPH